MAGDERSREELTALGLTPGSFVATNLVNTQ
jgi:hypothetical protein